MRSLHLHISVKTRSGIIFYLFFSLYHIWGQQIEPGYFMFPIKPGKQNFLTGNMGELRPGHFHAGLDIKTDGREGLPVYAAAKGYVFRAVIGERGYGKVLFMKHPNGHITVYAHNKQFEPKLDSVMRSIQYQKQSFQVDVDFKKDEIMYKKGDIIAYSGNSGSSGGPHLHFEIRDSLGNYLNPLANQFSEVKDKKSPFISKVALRPLHPFSRINDEYSRYELPFKKVNNNLYQGKDTVYIAEGQPIGVEVNTYDLMDGIYNLQGVNYISVAMDDSLVFDFALDKFSYEESHCIDMHVDYETLRRKGSWFHKCYIGDGNIIQAYKTKNRGFITINDTAKSHKVTITVKDFNHNSTQVFFYLSARAHQPFYHTKTPLLRRFVAPKRKMTEQMTENVLKLEYSDKEDNMNLLAELYCKGKIIPLPPSYIKNKYTTVYLVDLRQQLPDSLVICDFSYPMNFKKMIVPKRKDEYTEGNVNLFFNEKTLYDTLFLRFSKDGDSFTINDYTVPFDEYLGIKINNLNALEDKPHTAAFADAGRKRLTFAGGKWASDSSNLYFKTKGPGTYTIARDIMPPSLRVSTRNRKDIVFKASDGGSGIAKYECFVDSNWVLMNYDYKRTLFWSEKINKTIPFKGQLLIRITDNLGNIKEEKYLIK